MTNDFPRVTAADFVPHVVPDELQVEIAQTTNMLAMKVTASIENHMREALVAFAAWLDGHDQSYFLMAPPEQKVEDFEQWIRDTHTAPPTT